MSRKTLALTDALSDYLYSILPEEPPVLVRLREETGADPEADMQIAPEQGHLLSQLVRLTGARNIVELGTFTGYSTLCMALALPPHGRIVTCDISRKWTDIARRYWQEARVENRVELHVASALDTLDMLLAEGQEKRFDMAFIDADKENYIGYYEYAIKLLRPGGLVVADNILWSGKVAEPDMLDKDTVAIRAFNNHLKHDSRITLSVIPIGDGFALAVKN